MRLQNHRLLKSSRRRKNQSERGVALITTLLLLMLLTGLSLAMVLSVRSDMLINGNYRNFRGSFYAADSGLNAARTYLQDQVVATIPASFGITTQPIPNGTDGTIQGKLNTGFGAAYSTYTQGQAASSWPGKYQVTGTFVLDPTNGCTVLGGSGTCSAPTGPVTGYKYIYNYTLQSIGQAQNSQATTLTDRGSITVNATLIPVNSTTSFAAWGMFIDQWNACSGTLVPGTISGPAFTNGAWTFGTSGSYIFTDTVGSGSSDAGYQFSNSCDQVNATSDKKNGQTIAPQFQAGFQTGQAAVPLPTNDFNQKRAVLDGQGTSSSPVTNSDLHNGLKNVGGASYPSSGANSGVYLPYSIVNGQPTLNGGGIYVESNPNLVTNVVLSTATGPAPGNSAQQVYTISQGSPAVTTTITVDPVANTTTVVSGGNTLPIQGIPHMTDPVTAATSPGTMLYVDGNINSLSGPGQGQPAINNGSALTVTAASNVTVTGDILYKTEPVTLTQNQIPGQPADTLIPGNNNGQTLGIFTSTGDIQLNNKQANGNLEIDASLATISQNGTGGLVNVGAQINTLTIVGGRIQNQIKNIGATTRNVFFDRRYSQSGFCPPFFPSTHLSLGAITSAHATTTVQRLQWLNQSSYF
jgi:Tfp pilus assembly protein PilX